MNKYLGFETVQPWSPWLTCKDHLVVSPNHSLQPSAITLTQLPKSVQPNNTMGGYRIKAIYFWLVNLFCFSCYLLLGLGRDESGRVMSFVGGIRLSGGGWRWLQWLLAKVVVSSGNMMGYLFKYFRKLK